MALLLQQQPAGKALSEVHSVYYDLARVGIVTDVKGFGFHVKVFRIGLEHGREINASILVAKLLQSITERVICTGVKEGHEISFRHP